MTGIPAGGKRLTEDVDFAVHSDDLDRAADVAREKGHRVERLKMGGWRVVVRCKAGDVPVDFIDGGPELRQLFDNAVEFATARDIGGGVRLPVVRKNYLVATKLAAGAAQDEQDVEWLLRTVHGKKRYRELRSFVVSMVGLGGAATLDRIARRIGHPGPGMQQRN